MPRYSQRFSLAVTSNQKRRYNASMVTNCYLPYLQVMDTCLVHYSNFCFFVGSCFFHPCSLLHLLECQLCLFSFQVAKCAYAVIIIAVFWVFEVMPIAVTSLIPIFLFPLLGIMKSGEVCKNYANVSRLVYTVTVIVANPRARLVPQY